MSTVLPQYGSRQAAIEAVVYETDRNNQSRIPLQGVTSIEADWDIDRAGSKSRVDITTSKRVLRDAMWIAPHVRIIPEVGDIIEQQMGHFRLETPSSAFDGSVDEWGEEVSFQAAVGYDFADVLAKANLPFTVTTPRGGLVMPDVRFLIKLATMGVVRPIPLVNGSFEATPFTSGWTTGWVGGAAGTLHSGRPDTSMDVPDGRQLFTALFTSMPVGGYAYAWQRVLVPPGARRMMATGQYFRYRSQFRGSISLQFRDVAGNILGSIIATNMDTQRSYRWERGYVIADVPEGAHDVRVYVEARVVTAGAISTGVSWDDIRLYSITNEPLPDSRINLPPSEATASSRIQTTGGGSIGYDAINADRLGASGFHAIYTDMTGRLTTSQSRNLDDGTPSHIYTDDDFRFVGVKEVERSALNRFNTVTAVKESFEEGVAPMVVTVWNDDRNDPWSVHGEYGNVRYPNGPLMVQDAVSEADLEAAALAVLARASEQQELRIQVRPDTTLTVHSIIQIDSEHEELNGRWLVEYMRPGLSAESPLVELGCRRSTTNTGVSSG